jgi:hypothetical protein
VSRKTSTSPASLRISGAVPTAQTVSCILPGHDRLGTELYAERLQVRDDAFADEFVGNCAFAAGFEYRSDE